MIKIKENIFRIVQVGTGATGSWLVSMLTQLLANIEGNSLTLIDGDILEDKNLQNQHFLKKDVGRYKAEVLCERYQKIYRKLNITFVPEYIKEKEKIIKLLCLENSKIMPILISCVDNNSSRAIFHSVFHDEKIKRLIYIDSGNGSDNRIGQVVVGYKNASMVQDTTGDTNYVKLNAVEQIILPPVGDVFPQILQDNDDINKVLSCSYHSEEAPQNISSNITAAAMLFDILNNIIAFNEITSNIVYFDAAKPEAVSR